jgi:superfamily II DNA or RNA helicase
MSAAKRAPRATKASIRTRQPPRLSPHKAPEGMCVEEWQRALRRQFGREQAFAIENVGAEPIFSEFRVVNPEFGSIYRVRIGGLQLGDNQCDCADFRTNELGTCKHIECVLARLERKRGGKAALRRGFRPPYSELFLQPGNPRMLRLRLGSEAPEAVVELARALFRVESDGTRQRWLLDAERSNAVQRLARSCARHGHVLRIDAAAHDHMAGLRDAGRRRAVLAKTFAQGVASPALAKLVKVPLYPYQAEGALFAVAAGRALIADDMGLGKTVQAIAAAEIFARHFGVRRVLVICPTSLKHQWQREIARFAGRRAQVIDGGRQARRALFEADEFCRITNYEKLRPDLDLIQAWSPELVIVDEAQRVKNWNTIAARSIKRLDSPYAIVLTGTPLENKLEELISIVQFVDQHRLGPTWKLMHEHTQRDESGRVTGYIGLDRIGRSLAPILIRRRKAEVLTQLPARTDQQVLVPMTELQASMHEDNAQIAARIVQRWRGSGYLSDSDQRRLTCALQNMRMACDSSHLLDPETDHGVKADELVALLDALFANPDEKVVVFSQWLRMHAVLIRRFQARGWGHVLFHGGVPSDRRQDLVDRFGSDPQCRIFLATDAGSTGLNLQHASTLVNVDLPWNPAVLEQRVARIHRLGQQRPIRVVNFVARGTIEEGMLSVLAFKRSLAAGILDRGDGEVRLEGTRLARFMKEVESVTGAVQPTAPIAALEEMAAVAAAPEQTEAQRDDHDDVRGPERGHAAPAEASSAALAAASSDPWAVLLGAGTQLVQALEAASRPPGAAPVHPWIERDAQTGQAHLRLPLPDADTVGRIAEVVVGLANALARQRP